jgi:hypothetical protein
MTHDSVFLLEVPDEMWLHCPQISLCRYYYYYYCYCYYYYCYYYLLAFSTFCVLNYYWYFVPETVYGYPVPIGASSGVM